jgi:hypothetical protein
MALGTAQTERDTPKLLQQDHDFFGAYYETREIFHGFFCHRRSKKDLFYSM